MYICSFTDVTDPVDSENLSTQAEKHRGEVQVLLRAFLKGKILENNNSHTTCWLTWCMFLTCDNTVKNLLIVILKQVTLTVSSYKYTYLFFVRRNKLLMWLVDAF